MLESLGKDREFIEEIVLFKEKRSKRGKLLQHQRTMRIHKKEDLGGFFLTEGDGQHRDIPLEEDEIGLSIKEFVEVIHDLEKANLFLMEHLEEE